MTAGYTWAKPDTFLIDKKIKGILARGNVARFEAGNKRSQKIVVKHVTEWNPDDMGDLTAAWSNGLTCVLCPYATEYMISEITPAEAAMEQSWSKE